MTLPSGPNPCARAVDIAATSRSTANRSTFPSSELLANEPPCALFVFDPGNQQTELLGGR
jgi:hypothetical protein